MRDSLCTYNSESPTSHSNLNEISLGGKAGAVLKTREEVFSESEEKHYEMLDGLFYAIERSPNCLFAWNHATDDIFSNFATRVNDTSGNTQQLFSAISHYFEEKQRPLTVFATPFSEPKNLRTELEERGYKIAYRDAWMYYYGSQEEPVIAPAVNIEIIKTDGSMRRFVETFNKAYAGNDPREPYGQAPPAWGETLYSSFSLNTPGRLVEYFLLTENDLASTVLITCRIGDYAGIYAVGTALAMRGKGHASAMMRFAVHRLQQQGSKNIFLQTEKDSLNEKLYIRLGFTTEWIAEAWTLPA